MESFTPIVFNWNEACDEAFVTGDFNEFALTELEGDSVKTVVSWLKPGVYYYRFMVDGTYQPSQLKPTVLMYGRLYHQLTVESLPSEIRDLQHMTAEQLEKMDEELFSIATDSSDSLLSDDEGVSAVLQTTPVREVSCKLKARPYAPVKAAAVKIQAKVRMFLCRVKYLKYRETSLRSTMVHQVVRKVKLSEDSVLARVISTNLSLRRLGGH
jgi:hypothetical protein